MQEFQYIHCPSYYEEDKDTCPGKYYKTKVDYLYEKCLTCPKRVKEANG